MYWRRNKWYTKLKKEEEEEETINLWEAGGFTPSEVLLQGEIARQVWDVYPSRHRRHGGLLMMPQAS